MKCFRCNGAMNDEVFHSNEGNFWGWRCLYCGEIFDETILENRQHPRSGKHGRKG